MRVSLMQKKPGRVFAVILDPGDEVVESITGFAARNGVNAAHFAAIGAFSHATLAWFNPETREYEHLPVKEQVEVASLVGNISIYEGKPKVHAHAAVARRDGTAVAGHVMEAYARPTLEIFVTELQGELQREIDAETSLPLISLRET